MCWHTAAFVGRAFVGKLKPLRHYIKTTSSTSGQQAPVITKEEFDKRLAKAKERKEKNVTKKS